MFYKSLEDAVEAAKKNDQRAFGFLYDECWDYVYGYLFKISKDERIAEELSLKTLSKAFDKIDKFNPKFRFKSWVITISKNLHIDFLRKQNASNKIEFYITNGIEIGLKTLIAMEIFKMMSMKQIQHYLS